MEAFVFLDQLSPFVGDNQSFVCFCVEPAHDGFADGFDMSGVRVLENLDQFETFVPNFVDFRFNHNLVFPKYRFHEVHLKVDHDEVGASPVDDLFFQCLEIFDFPEIEVGDLDGIVHVSQHIDVVESHLDFFRMVELNLV